MHTCPPPLHFSNSMPPHEAELQKPHGKPGGIQRTPVHTYDKAANHRISSPNVRKRVYLHASIWCAGKDLGLKMRPGNQLIIIIIIIIIITRLGMCPYGSGNLWGLGKGSHSHHLFCSLQTCHLHMPAKVHHTPRDLWSAESQPCVCQCHSYPF